MIPLNTQPKEKQELREDGALDVHSVFYTIQGEGPCAGRPAVFVRLAGCDLDCPGCDTDYTSKRKWYNPESLVRLVTMEANRVVRKEHPFQVLPTLIVLTGGEPFRQNFAPFARLAVYSGFRLQVETNGTLWFEEHYPARWDVVCSPKAPKIHESLKRYIRALKYIVKAGEIDPNDGLPTSVLENGLRPCRPWEGYTGEIYLQPFDQGHEGNKWFVTKDGVQTTTTINEANREYAVESCMKFGYRLSLQTHKILGLE